MQLCRSNEILSLNCALIIVIVVGFYDPKTFLRGMAGIRILPIFSHWTVSSVVLILYAIHSQLPLTLSAALIRNCDSLASDKLHLSTMTKLLGRRVHALSQQPKRPLSTPVVRPSHHGSFVPSRDLSRWLLRVKVDNSVRSGFSQLVNPTKARRVPKLCNSIIAFALHSRRHYCQYAA